ncbi:RING-H2 finger protein ATL1-like [Gastrolobium bilobum]|uniref:RING-H2 finger protein ATL1-like n=1 Tax=Gastrolobium bilobum TaxID=150636 RepID=UPI002AB20FB8|nr:RING-H2 finger protein ATL1-like [Gastrolobium bilobum]
MDFVSKRHLIHVLHMSQDLPPSISHPHLGVHPSSTSFPIIGIIVIGILATSFLLMSYYIFVIKCCLHWHIVDHVRGFSLSSRHEEPSAAYSPASEPRGLEETVIRLIPVIHYKTEGNTDFGERSLCECAVCLNEFQEDEKLRVIPNCSHIFHIDCIDVWLQNNANCPLCRRSISLTSQTHVDDQLLTPRPSPRDHSTHVENLIGGDDFVVIDLDNEHDTDQNLQGRQEERGPISPSQRKFEQRIVQKKARKLHKVISMGDECISVRAKDGPQSVQPIRRSFSMDSSVDRKFYLPVQQSLQQQNEVNSIEVCGDSGRVKRSFFSFGHGSRSRSAVLPVYLDP